MERDAILQLSRKENENAIGEYEAAAISSASKISMLIGGALCAILALVGSFVFEARELPMGVCAVYFAMMASNNVVRYINLKKRFYLVWGIIDAAISVASLVLLLLIWCGV